MSDDMMNKPEGYWKKRLTPEQYHVAFEKGTEAPFTGKYVDNFETGMYHCVACGQPLFASDTKFNSDCGWPSFDRSIEGNVKFQDDTNFGMRRSEVLCNNCGAHLGHIFDDGPRDLPDGRQATGKRFCINSAVLDFHPKK